MEKKKTALQQAIDNLICIQNNLIHQKVDEFTNIKIAIGDEIVEILSKCLPLEKQQMEEAWIKGMSSHPNNEKAQFNDFDDYYKETYETE